MAESETEDSRVVDHQPAIAHRQTVGVAGLADPEVAGISPDRTGTRYDGQIIVCTGSHNTELVSDHPAIADDQLIGGTEITQVEVVCVVPQRAGAGHQHTVTRDKN